MVTAYQLVRPKFADDAFSGEGARLEGGRWNSRGRRIVYVASSVPLATLELLVRIPKRHRLRRYSLIECTFSDDIVEVLDRSLLPHDWRAFPSPPLLRVFGDQWIIGGKSAVLAVPSAVSPTDLNFLLNPEHPDFRSIKIGKPRRFALDLRLVT